MSERIDILKTLVGACIDSEYTPRVGSDLNSAILAHTRAWLVTHIKNHIAY